LHKGKIEVKSISFMNPGGEVIDFYPPEGGVAKSTSRRISGKVRRGELNETERCQSNIFRM
jgi:hypothetical protein